LDALRLVETSGKSIPQIERDLGIQAFPGQGRLTPEQEELRRLKRENEILRQERDILKSSGHLLAPKQMRFQYVKDHRVEFPVILMCTVLMCRRAGATPGVDGRPAAHPDRYPDKTAPPECGRKGREGS